VCGGFLIYKDSEHSPQLEWLIFAVIAKVKKSERINTIEKLAIEGSFEVGD
jgi:hypothetical protein